MTQIFVDTSAFVALTDKKDRNHLRRESFSTRSTRVLVSKILASRVGSS